MNVHPIVHGTLRLFQIGVLLALTAFRASAQNAPEVSALVDRMSSSSATIAVPSANLASDPCTRPPTSTCIVDGNTSQPCVGTPGGTVIIGSSGADVIIGGSGSDQVLGGGGDDIICGGAGDDTLMGDEGNDFIDGGEGDDHLDGGDGDDTLRGGPGSNRLIGKEGYDTCVDAILTSGCESNSNSGGAAANKCEQFLGKWHWFDNGMVLFTDDRRVQWHEPKTGRKGHSANWVCDGTTGTITIPWTNGFTDTMQVIASGSSLQGKNNRGMTIWAQRIPE